MTNANTCVVGSYCVLQRLVKCCGQEYYFGDSRCICCDVNQRRRLPYESICVHNEAHEITYVLYHAVVSSRYYNLVTEENNFSKEKRVIIYILNRPKCCFHFFFQ